jgi:hypothetical protein
MLAEKEKKLKGKNSERIFSTNSKRLLVIVRNIRMTLEVQTVESSRIHNEHGKLCSFTISRVNGSLTV